MRIGFGVVDPRDVIPAVALGEFTSLSVAPGLALLALVEFHKNEKVRVKFENRP